MKANELLESFGELNDSIIESAGQARASKKAAKPKVSKWFAVAACLVAVAAALITFVLKPNEPETLTINFEPGSFGSFGSEEYILKDISELKRANPWTPEAKINELPVYKNSFKPITDKVTDKKTLDEMKKRLKEVAGKFDLNCNQIKIDRSVGIMSVCGEAYYAEADSTGTVRVSADIALAENYRITEFSSYEELKKIGEYIISNHSSILKMQKPTFGIDSTGCSPAGDEQYYLLLFFDLGNSDEQSVLNFGLNKVYALIGEGGTKITLRWVFRDLSCEVGQYPIIGLDEAKSLLSKGYCFTSDPNGLPENAEISRAELVYLNEIENEYIVPFYKFYVDVTNSYGGETVSDLKVYGAFYVPAVESRYVNIK